MWDSCQGKHSYQKGHLCDPKGPGAKAPGSSVHDTQQPPPYQAPSDIFRYTTEELRSIAAQYATGNETMKLCPTPSSREATSSSSKEASFDVTVHDAKEGTKGGKKRCKQRPQ
jgi:hypothetical protein